MIASGRDIRETELEADVVVVGTGAGGAMMLRELARAGLSVIGLEEGGYHTPSTFTQREEAMFPLLYQEAGGRTTHDMAIRVLQGRGVGGSTIHNTNLCKRIPDEILMSWTNRHGVEGIGPEVMRAHFERVERDLSVAPISGDAVNRNNQALRRGVETLGWKGAVLAHNRVGCIGSGFCELGCTYDAKQNALKILIPEAMQAGARVYADVRADKVVVSQGRAVGIAASVLHGGAVVRSLRVHARAVVLAASATGSAALALASRLDDPHEQLGRGLRLHPGAAVAGVFDDALHSYRGIPQSYECTEWLSFEEGSDKRVWIVTAFAHPIGTAAAMPGFGAPHMRAMRDYAHLAVLTAMVHDETEGRVTLANDGRPVLHYDMSLGDRAQLATGIRACARILLAAGAKRVLVPALVPRAVASMRELDALDLGFVAPHMLPLSAVHPMGTMRMGRDPRRSAVDGAGEHHHTRGLFVADGSLFPTSIGGPPQIGIYALAMHLAPHVVARARG